MKARTRAGIAGAVGLVLAFGLAELVHGLYGAVPSVLVSVAQRIIELTPGGLATRAVEILGQADIPTLVSSTVIGTLVISALLANLSLRSPTVALLGVGALALVGLYATFAQPSVAPFATVATVVGALAVGAAVAELLLRASGLRGAAEPVPEGDEPEREAQTAGVRSREAHSSGGILVNRGSFLAIGGGAAVAGLAAAGVGRALAGGGSSQASSPGSLELANSSGNTTGGGTTQATVQNETLPPPPEDASLDVEGMPPLITPAKDFYLIDTAISSPQLNKDNWTLKVKGAVDNPIELSYSDLLGMSTREADVTLSCVSNEVGGGLVSNGRWTGVMLSDVLEEAGISREKLGSASEQLVGRSVDGFTAGFRTEIALDGREALVAFGLNGSELPVKHGYPVRLVVPGLYGYVSATKWLSEIELTNWDFDAYWIQRTWNKEGPIMTQSRIDTVSGGDQLQKGTIPIGGVAWDPHQGISRVEVSTDGGESWSEARLAAQLDVDTWRQYVYEWDASSTSSGEHTLQVRATNGEGETQTSEETSPHPGGATGHHTVKVNVA